MNQSKSGKSKSFLHRLLSLDFAPFRSEESAVARQLDEARRFAAFAGPPRPSRDRVNVDRFKDSEEARYINQTPISEGRTAVVYSAYDSRLRRTIALKRFRNDPEINSDNDYIAERNSAATVRHPNVVSTYDADRDEEGAFITMEFLKGRNAQQEVKKHGPFSAERFVRFASHSIDAIMATHRGGLLHLDVKPTNIMISEQAGGAEMIKLVDFGRARSIRDDDGKPPIGRGLEGSIYYSSPEQLLGEELDETADLYCLGCVFYWVLTGKRPFTASNSFELKEAHLQGRVKHLAEILPDLPEGMADWVMSLITFNKKKRPQSSEELMESFNSYSWALDDLQRTTTELDKVLQAQPARKIAR